MSMCPCGSGKTFSHCCGPYLDGNVKVPTAEALMRSRYTAYALDRINYIENTNAPETRDKLDMKATREWIEESTWKGLNIIKTEAGGVEDTEGVVEFEAKYQVKDEDLIHHEVSSFVKHDGVWYYLDGYTPTTTVTRESPKVGRNDPCPCGSGKKFKKCCG